MRLEHLPLFFVLTTAKHGGVLGALHADNSSVKEAKAMVLKRTLSSEQKQCTWSKSRKRNWKGHGCRGVHYLDIRRSDNIESRVSTIVDDMSFSVAVLNS
ncbi:hypothetical protein Y032_0145g2485 [Ancylostoma ceylanicum]|uniref:Uncharacterized protein n=1 Tax=Ancylostoma ceylanicum TaxID=53326 RepID=A0A016T1N8_9BILA|nr:hypothetical protein Y032_0145g2485 [Ancylostoma ceylanicum]